MRGDKQQFILPALKVAVAPGAQRLRRANALSSGMPKLWMSRRVSACAPSRVSMMLATSSTVFSGISISPFGWGV